MKQQPVIQSNLYAFLEKSGVLEWGTAEQIATAKKQYWNEYKTNWRRQKRATQQEMTIAFTQQEYQLICKAAESYKRSKAPFIKAVVMAYCKKESLFPDMQLFYDLREALMLLYTKLRDNEEEGLVNTKGSIELSERITIIEQIVFAAMQKDQHTNKSIL